MSQPSTNSHPSSSSSMLHLKHKEYSEYPYRCIIFMDYKRTRERKKVQFKAQLNVTRNITSHSSWNTKLWNLNHAISSNSGCFWWWRLLCGWGQLEVLLAAALWLRTVLMNCRWEIYKKEQGLIGFLPWERKVGRGPIHHFIWFTPVSYYNS